VTLVHKYFDGQAPAEWDTASFTDPAAGEALAAVVAAAQKAAAEVPAAWSSMRLNEALDVLWDMIERANEFTDRAEPWKSGKDPARRTELGTTLSALLETLRLAAIWGWPAMPSKCEQLWTMLGLPGTPGEQHGDNAQPRFGVTPARPLGPSQILFPRIDLKTVSAS
jgi:methionyl-tRNA synthetase